MQLHRSLVSLEADAELLRSQLLAAGQEKLGQEREVTELQRKLQDAEGKVGRERRVTGPTGRPVS